jgi:hypothetical protein
MTSKINHNLEIGAEGTEYTLKVNGEDLTAKVKTIETKTEKITCEENTTIDGDLYVGLGDSTTRRIYLNGVEFTGAAANLTGEDIPLSSEEDAPQVSEAVEELIAKTSNLYKPLAFPDVVYSEENQGMGEPIATGEVYFGHPVFLRTWQGAVAVDGKLLTGFFPNNVKIVACGGDLETVQGDFSIPYYLHSTSFLLPARSGNNLNINMGSSTSGRQLRIWVKYCCCE